MVYPSQTFSCFKPGNEARYRLVSLPSILAWREEKMRHAVKPGEVANGTPRQEQIRRTGAGQRQQGVSSYSYQGWRVWSPPGATFGLMCPCSDPLTTMSIIDGKQWCLVIQPGDDVVCVLVYCEGRGGRDGGRERVVCCSLTQQHGTIWYTLLAGDVFVETEWHLNHLNPQWRSSRQTSVAK